MRSPVRHKVILYNPDAVFFTMPLALVAVGSHLDAERYEVIIVDGRLEKDPVGALAPHLAEALCFGVTVLTGAPIRDAVTVSRAVKRARPDLPVIWGGWHPSMFGAECLAEPSVDATVQAQGEVTFAEIVERLANGESLEGCAGCTFRAADGSARRNPARPLADVNQLGRHDYGLIDVERYYRLKRKPQLDYITSQGCFFRCAFCADPFVYKRRWVGLEPARVGEELESLWRRHDFSDVNFQDETFFTYAPRVGAIAEELLRRELRITWAATMRADQCQRLPDDIFETCRRSGLRRVLIGVESGSPEMLERIRKDITLDQVFFAAERCRKAGIAGIFPFIVGFPGESEESVQASIDVAKRLREMTPAFETPIFYFKPYPGSAITLEAVRSGYALPATLDEWADFDFIGSSGPWVSADKQRRIERFKFYQALAWRRASTWLQPMQRVARWRCRNDIYALPVEKAVSEWLRPPARLS